MGVGHSTAKAYSSERGFTVCRGIGEGCSSQLPIHKTDSEWPVGCEFCTKAVELLSAKCVWRKVHVCSSDIEFDPSEGWCEFEAVERVDVAVIYTLVGI